MIGFTFDSKEVKSALMDSADRLEKGAEAAKDASNPSACGHLVIAAEIIRSIADNGVTRADGVLILLAAMKRMNERDSIETRAGGEHGH